MTPCHICGQEAVIDGEDPLCSRHVTACEQMSAMPGLARGSVSDAINALIDDERYAFECLLLMAVEDVVNGASKQTAAIRFGIPLNVLLIKWRKFSVSRLAWCVLHRGRCPECSRP